MSFPSLSNARFQFACRVLGDGRLLEKGTHQELLALGGQYKTLHDVQSKAFEDTSK